MPAKRKSGRQPNGPATKQSTLSFNHRVTKNVPKPGKDSLLSSSEISSSPRDAPSRLIPEEIEEIKPKPVTEETNDKDVIIAPHASKSVYELEAEDITDTAIESYWRRVESERIAQRVHQEDLTVGEKILRYFDVNSQYGPCIGITRIKRWHRAQKLGFNPPIEVLAVLLDNESKLGGSGGRACMDNLMNSTTLATS